VPDEVYIYWHIGTTPMAQALRAAASLQQALREQHPALQTRLLHRGAGSAQATVMEIYRCPGGVNAVLRQAVERQAALHLAPLLEPPQRHVEVFESADEPMSDRVALVGVNANSAATAAENSTKR
jgi:Domain of unknown function (DUF4936)